MNVSVPIPDEFARRLSSYGENVGRRLLEALVIDEFRRDRLSRPEVKQLLGFATRGELDTFLLAHQLVGRYDANDLHRDRSDLQRLGL